MLPTVLASLKPIFFLRRYTHHHHTHRICLYRFTLPLAKKWYNFIFISGTMFHVGWAVIDVSAETLGVRNLREYWLLISYWGPKILARASVNGPFAGIWFKSLRQSLGYQIEYHYLGCLQCLLLERHQHPSRTSLFLVSYSTFYYWSNICVCHWHEQQKCTFHLTLCCHHISLHHSDRLSGGGSKDETRNLVIKV